MEAWSERDIVKLIEFYEVHPCLWDTLRKDYRNKDKKKALEKEIADTLNRTGTL